MNVVCYVLVCYGQHSFERAPFKLSKSLRRFRGAQTVAFDEM